MINNKINLFCYGRKTSDLLTLCNYIHFLWVKQVKFIICNFTCPNYKSKKNINFCLTENVN